MSARFRPSLTALRRPVALTSAALWFCLALSGCQTYTDRSAARDQALRNGDIATALRIATQDVEKNPDGKDTLLLQLEQGAILRAAALADLPAPPASSATPATGATDGTGASHPGAGHLRRSIEVFDAAAARIDAFEAAARVRVGAETGALLTNQANTPYRGRAYDKVMLHTYQALNYLQLHQDEAARVELNRALQSQRDAVAANARRIAEAQELAADARSGGVTDEQGRQGKSYDVDRARRDPLTASSLSSIESKLDAAILPYGDYVNPFTTFLDALVFTHQGTDASDLERARKSWERVVNFAPSNPHARADYVAVEPDLQSSAAQPPPAAPGAQPASLGPPPSERLTYVIFETGAAPYRQQTRIDIPVFLFSNQLSYVGAAFPTLETVPGHAAPLIVNTGDGRSVRTSLVASMDSVIAQDFKNEWPSILTKTLISTATKATLDAVLQKQIEDQTGPTGALLFKLATAVTQIAINVADTRTWRSLPKEFHYARLPTPADGRLQLSAGGLATSVTVEPAAVTVVYVKSAGTFSPLLVDHFVLKK